MLDDILKRLGRGQAVGLVDRRLDDATTPMRVVLARYLRHLRGKRTGRKQIKQVCAYIKWVIDKTSMERLADFTGDRLDRALGMLASVDLSTTTINRYRNRSKSA